MVITYPLAIALELSSVYCGIEVVQRSIYMIIGRRVQEHGSFATGTVLQVDDDIVDVRFDNGNIDGISLADLTLINDDPRYHLAVDMEEPYLDYLDEE